MSAVLEREQEAADMTGMRALRERAGLSQIELAVRAGVSVGAVQKLEGPGLVTEDTARAIARVLGVRPEEVDELRPSVEQAIRRGRRPGVRGSRGR